MARVNITIPDGLVEQARTAGLNISALAAAALADELERREKIAALDTYLAELESELGPIPEAELAEGRAWVEQMVTDREARSA